jgi:O-antigen/teichoic acid export membrane protein
LSGLTLKRNLSANLIGKAVAGVLGFVFIPMYVRFLGIESYGLVGLFATITALGSAADCGLSATASRELSRLSVQPHSNQAMRDLVRTLEVGSWIIAALLGAVITFGAPLVMKSWVQPTGLSSQIAHYTVLEMGVALALQWPVNFYANAMIGLQHQVALNVINVGMAAIRGAGAVVVLWGISSTIEAFFAWQIAVSGCHVVCVSQQMWRRLPSAPARARFHLGAIQQAWRFAVGMGGLTLLTVLNTQVDKLVLSQSLTLTSFGYYCLAWSVAGYLSMLCDPIMLAFLPHMAQLVSLDNKAGLDAAYHRAAQVMSVAIFPVTIFIALFAKEILSVWTKDPTVAQHAAPLVTILICGSALQAVCSVPLALQWAYGWTAPAFWARVGTLALQIPAVYILGRWFGGVGGAAVWLGSNVAILLVIVWAIYWRLLRGKLKQWLGGDLLPPLAAALAVAGVWRAVDVPMDGRHLAVFLALAAGSTLFATMLTVPAGVQTLVSAFRGGVRLGQLALLRKKSVE